MNPPQPSLTVAYVVGGLPFGGIENWLLDLSQGIGEVGVRPVVVNISGQGLLMPRYRQAGVEVVCVSDSKDALKTFRMDTVWHLAQVLRGIDPDLIHTLHFSGDYFGRLASLLVRRPVVTHIRNTKIERKIHRRVINRLLSFATDCYLSVSRAVREECVEPTHNLARRPSLVLYNAVDPAKFEAYHYTKAQVGAKGKRIILGVGRMVSQKNYDLLIRSMPEVLKGCPEAVLFLVGEGPDRQTLQDLAGSLGLDDRVSFLGYRDDVPGIMQVSDLLVMPSDYEGLPITHLEALFAGLPAVISDRVPSAEIAADCSLICRRDPADIARCIRLLLEDPVLYERMSRTARALSAEFTMTGYVRKLAAIYDDVLTGRLR